MGLGMWMLMACCLLTLFVVQVKQYNTYRMIDGNSILLPQFHILVQGEIGAWNFHRKKYSDGMSVQHSISSTFREKLLENCTNKIIVLAQSPNLFTRNLGVICL